MAMGLVLGCVTLSQCHSVKIKSFNPICQGVLEPGAKIEQNFKTSREGCNARRDISILGCEALGNSDF